eukprot:546229-Prymnesium_polylepis.1
MQHDRPQGAEPRRPISQTRSSSRARCRNLKNLVGRRQWRTEAGTASPCSRSKPVAARHR